MGRGEGRERERQGKRGGETERRRAARELEEEEAQEEEVPVLEVPRNLRTHRCLWKAILGEEAEAQGMAGPQRPLV